MIKLKTFSLLIWSITCFSQSSKLTEVQLNTSGANKIFFIENSSEAKNLAKQDIENGNPILFLQSGISPTLTSKDIYFEETYNVHYFDFGCVGPEIDFVIEYNKIIFEYLLKNYSRKFLKDVRKDVIGFKKFKKQLK